MRRLDEEEQRRLLGHAIQSNFARLASGMDISQTELERLRSGLEEQREAAKAFIATANLLEDHLDGGFGMQSGLGGKQQAVEVYEKLAQGKYFGIGDVKTALAPLTGRYGGLAGLRGETRTADLVEKVRKDTDPAVVMDAWQRLGSDAVNWPATPDDLESERQLHKTLATVIDSKTKSAPAGDLAKQRIDALTGEWQQRGPAMWRRFMVARRGEAETAAALAKGLDKNVLDDFGIADPAKVEPPLPVAVQFNMFLVRGKPQVNRLAPKLEDKKSAG
jgi:hypothetical protein